MAEKSNGSIHFKKDATGHFPIVDKMIEVAQKYGFDGWFINQETEIGLTKPMQIL